MSSSPTADLLRDQCWQQMKHIVKLRREKAIPGLILREVSVLRALDTALVIIEKEERVCRRAKQ